MSDQFVDAAKERMGAIERLLKGLPGIRGYVDKEMRRDADKRLRELIAQELEVQKQALLEVRGCYGLTTSIRRCRNCRF
jgi:hypothetical protein